MREDLCDCEECCICMEKMRKTRLYKSKCSHFFHTKCVWKWKEIRNNCPLCRREDF